MKEIAEDMSTLIEKVSATDDSPIRTKNTELSAVSLIGPPSEFLKTKMIPQPVQNSQKEVWSGDASAIAACVNSCTDPDGFVLLH